MLDQTRLKDKLEMYKRDFIPHWENEKFKWEAVKTFQDNWDINAGDFAEMLKQSISKTDELLTSKNYFAKGMIEGFADAAPEETRAMFRMLFDESQDIASRIIKFRDDSEQIRKKYTPEANQPYQDAFAASVYLWLRYPDQDYILKYSVIKAAAKRLGSDYKFKKGDYATNFKNNSDFLDEIRAYIKSDSELIDLFQSQLTDDCYPDPEYRTLAFDVGFYIGKYLEDEEPETEIEDKVKDVDDRRPIHYWLYSPGTNAEHWDEFFNKGIMAIGWEDIGDLNRFASKEEIVEKMQGLDGSTTSHKNDALAMWQFVHEVQPGDIIFAKKGRQQIVGRGVVQSDYIYESDREYYPNVRHVKWTHNEEHTLSSAVAMKTLTDITQYTDLVDQLNDMFNDNQSEFTISEPVPDDADRGYWWVVASPKIWSFSNMKVGDEQNYTLYNENGHKRRIFQNFLDAKVGDLVIGYEANPVKQIVALGRISRGSDGENIFIEKTENLSSPIDYAVLKECPELENMEFFTQSNGSLFKLTKDEYDFIMDMIREENPLQKQNVEIKPYTKEKFLSEVYMSAERYDTLRELLLNKMNIILQGAPGVGKTFTAKRLAYSIMGEEDDSRIELIQFHQNYSYEDFIMGYRPYEDTFKLEDGVFYRFCQKARSDHGHKYFFIIDEINRGNMSKIFGELLMLIEKDYRETSAILAYNGLPFSVPDNLYIIGMMNTADRSLAMIDYALRRRFSFFEIEPAFDSEGFKKYQASLDNETFDALIEQIKELNKAIRNDQSLGKGFMIGHSYFCGRTKENCTTDWMRSVVEFDILPMLSEYWFDEPEKYNRWDRNLNGVFDDE